jgi:hypothetical protein
MYSVTSFGGRLKVTLQKDVEAPWECYQLCDIRDRVIRAVLYNYLSRYGGAYNFRSQFFFFLRGGFQTSRQTSLRDNPV